ncbi:hypothetical protein CARUB_v10014998mg [Capsella rubella]|uniref:Uncharacterized protein n=1 Tax=Capsella rubella TaxID=81985 RepID=R0G8C9_9BRAS|nr:hypothetical protein CARUB_v10014998mg [Capsella rubella]
MRTSIHCNPNGYNLCNKGKENSQPGGRSLQNRRRLIIQTTPTKSKFWEERMAMGATMWRLSPKQELYFLLHIYQTKDANAKYWDKALSNTLD